MSHNALADFLDFTARLLALEQPDPELQGLLEQVRLAAYRVDVRGYATVPEYSQAITDLWSCCARILLLKSRRNKEWNALHIEAAAPYAQLKAILKAMMFHGDLEPAKEAQPALPEFMSVADLATHLGMSADTVDAFLRRYRHNYPDCYTETEAGARRKKEPRYLYRTQEVMAPLMAHRDHAVNHR
jgi:hypothetical protein